MVGEDKTLEPIGEVKAGRFHELLPNNSAFTVMSGLVESRCIRIEFTRSYRAAIAEALPAIPSPIVVGKWAFLPLGRKRHGTTRGAGSVLVSRACVNWQSYVYVRCG